MDYKIPIDDLMQSHVIQLCITSRLQDDLHLVTYMHKLCSITQSSMKFTSYQLIVLYLLTLFASITCYPRFEILIRFFELFLKKKIGIRFSSTTILQIMCAYVTVCVLAFIPTTINCSEIFT